MKSVYLGADWTRESGRIVCPAYLVKYRLARGVEGFLGKVTLGWLGGWLGSPVFGYWPASVKLGSIYIVPALLGSVVGVFGVVLMLKVTECKHPAGK